MNKSIVWYIGVWFLCTRIICEYELSIDVFCFINKNFKMKRFFVKFGGTSSIVNKESWLSVVCFLPYCTSVFLPL